ncbi:hypothetical protein BZG36_02432 [Bifiguratus adelaidae]|uniref:Cyclin-like domain-containing protein n=1 Tax=Bifiguratus adelaidae TaxID=1938954 RepID=A0A261Y3M5_9FUNG|nr:hypothetical protein BZG36_02432 [Bifiguratus adelaidae]
MTDLCQFYSPLEFGNDTAISNPFYEPSLSVPSLAFESLMLSASLDDCNLQQTPKHENNTESGDNSEQASKKRRVSFESDNSTPETTISDHSSQPEDELKETDVLEWNPSTLLSTAPIAPLDDIKLQYQLELEQLYMMPNLAMTASMTPMDPTLEFLHPADTSAMPLMVQDATSALPTSLPIQTMPAMPVPQTSQPSLPNINYKPTPRLWNLVSAADKYQPDKAYLRTMQTNMKAGLRKELIHWMSETNHSPIFNYHSETIYCAINYLDRYLSLEPLTWTSRCYDVALCCLYIAGKFFEETNEPQIRDMRPFAVHDVSVEKIKILERDILTGLNYALHVVTPQAIWEEVLNSIPQARTSSVRTQVCQNLTRVAQTFLDLACSEWEYLTYLPQTLAIASLYTSLCLLGFDDQPETRSVFLQVTCVDVRDFWRCVWFLQACAGRANAGYRM